MKKQILFSVKILVILRSKKIQSLSNNVTSDLDDMLSHHTLSNYPERVACSGI